MNTINNGYSIRGIIVDYLLKVTLIGLISGITGTGIGGLMAFMTNRISNRTLGLVLEFSAGLMTAVVCFELIPEAIRSGSIVLTFCGLLIGVLSILLIEDYITRTGVLKRHHGDTKLLQTGILTAIGIALHNFPEGFAVGSGFEASVTLGITLTAIIMIHDIPEGIAMAVPMRAGGYSRIRAFTYTLLSGVPMGFGAFLGAALGGISIKFISVCLGFAGGAMLYIIYGELVPQSKRIYHGRLPTLGNIAGIICGILITVYN